MEDLEAEDIQIEKNEYLEMMRQIVIDLKKYSISPGNVQSQKDDE